MEKNSRIYIAGHTGMVGFALHKRLIEEGYTNILTRTHEELDLTDAISVKWFFNDFRPEYVFMCAGKVGGIKGNSDYPVEYLYENEMMALNVIKHSYISGVTKLMYTGSSCIYPKVCKQPIGEHELLSSYLEPTNEGYALAKISGIRLCQAYNREYGTNFISVLPCSLYGGKESYDLNNSHFIPAIMRRMHEAKVNGDQEVIIWGTGMPRREMMHVDDFTDAALFLMNNYDSTETINVGTGIDHMIKTIVRKVKRIVKFKGKVIYDISKPNGVMKKVLDVSKISDVGWKAKVTLDDGLKMMYKHYMSEVIGRE